MSNLLLPATPLYGHVHPMVTIGRALAERGHQVTVLTGRRYQQLVREHGLGFRPLPDEADITAAGSGAGPGPGPTDPRKPRRLRVLAGRDAVIAMFVRPLEAQHRALSDAMTSHPYDAVLCDTAYLGALPLLLTRTPRERVPVLGVSATPLSLVSTDCAPFGAAMQPGSNAFTRLRNRQIQWLLQHGPLRPLHDALDAALAEHGVAPGTLDYFDQVAAFDVTFHLAAREMEYPRREMPATVRFVGPLCPTAGQQDPLPPWWPDLDGPRPVVHVTQGTVDNLDQGKLILPTIRALAEAPVLTVVSTGGRPVAEVCVRLGGDLPPNVRIAPFLPYDRLLPRTALVVSNGGFGGVQQALRHGVPLVVAGDTEDKPEVAARVRWVGAGIDLHTGSPSVAQVRRAARRVLADSRYRSHAQRMGARIRLLAEPTTAIAESVEAAVKETVTEAVTEEVRTSEDQVEPRAENVDGRTDGRITRSRVR